MAEKNATQSSLDDIRRKTVQNQPHSQRENTRGSPLANPDLSVILPCFNEADRIEKVLDSWRAVLAEHVDSYEILVINDGSKDGTGRQLDRLRREIPEMRVIHQLNMGYPKALRRAYELCRGNHVLQVDSNGLHSPLDFPSLWAQKDSYSLVLGAQTTGGLPWLRLRALKILNHWARWLFDQRLTSPNTHYRLISREFLETILPQIPAQWESINLSFAILAELKNPGQCYEVPLVHSAKSRKPKRSPLTAFLWILAKYGFEISLLKISLLRTGSVGRLETASAPT